MKDCCETNSTPAKPTTPALHKGLAQAAHSHDHTHEHAHGHDHDHGAGAGDENSWKKQIPLLAALALLIIQLILEYGFHWKASPQISFLVNAAAYLVAGWSVLKLAFKKAIRGDFFNEFVLMSIATIGAFLIAASTEALAVMVFYSLGEWFQDSAVGRAKASIKALLDSRPDTVEVLENGKPVQKDPASVKPGEIILVKAGEKVALDGILLTESNSFNTAALTGESVPDTKRKGDGIYAGMINLQTVAEIQVTTLFKDSKLSKILSMVQDATARKSKTQLFISRFAKIYTPIVFLLALALVVLPYMLVDNYIFNVWLYRALVFLVISCPCALVISIPLGYFGGIGLASKNGILFKGGNFLDVMTKIDTLVTDKTGTLTKGVFKVQLMVSNDTDPEQFMYLSASLEQKSGHPAAKAIVEHVRGKTTLEAAQQVEEIAGHGLKGIVGGQEVLAGNLKLLELYEIDYPATLQNLAGTIVVIAVNRCYTGHYLIADEMKDDAPQAIRALHRLGLKVVMLSGDRQMVVDEVAKTLGIEEAYGGLMPEDKVAQLEKLKLQGHKTAFVGDGINDAPVLALADAGIAMGGLGSDAAIETADIVIQNDQLMKLPQAIRIGKITQHIVWQNIILAMSVKALVLFMGAYGVATLWEAVIADVGVALLAILNAVRIQKSRL